MSKLADIYARRARIRQIRERASSRKRETLDAMLAQLFQRDEAAEMAREQRRQMEMASIRCVRGGAVGELARLTTCQPQRVRSRNQSDWKTAPSHRGRSAVTAQSTRGDKVGASVATARNARHT